MRYDKVWFLLACISLLSVFGALPSEAQDRGVSEPLRRFAASHHLVLLFSFRPDDGASGKKPLTWNDTERVEKGIERIAQYYDALWSNRHGVYVFTRLRTRRDELPSESCPQYQQILKQVQKTCLPFNPHSAPLYAKAIPPVPKGRLTRDQYRVIDPSVAPLAASLTSAQLALMKTGRLSYRSLTSRQKDFVRNMLLTMVVQTPLQQGEPWAEELNQISQGAVICWGDLPRHPHQLGYRIEEHGQVKFVPLFLTTASPDQSASPRPGEAAQPSSASLNDMIERIKKRDPLVEISVAPECQDLPITEIGAEAAQTQGLLLAVSEIYGLDVHQSLEKGVRHFRIDPPPPGLVSSVGDLPAALRQAFPPSLAAFYHFGELTESYQVLVRLTELSAKFSRVDDTPGPSVSLPSEESPDALKDAMEEKHFMASGELDFQNHLDRVSAIETAMRRSVIEMNTDLGQRLMERLKAKPDGFPIQEVPELRDRLALVLFTRAITPSLDLMTRPMADELLAPERYSLAGGVYGDPQHPLFRVSFVQLDASGRLIRQGMARDDLDYRP